MTTCNERIRRVIEPGTPTADRIFGAVKKFTEAGVCCGINIDPIIPLITDGDEELYEIVRRCKSAGLQHVFGEILRLRADIWERMKITLELLNIPCGINRYQHIYHFEDDPNSNYVGVEKRYAEKILGRLELMIRNCGMSYKFPDCMQSRSINKSCSGQTTMLNYIL
jgi:DNA repair photolyase